MPWKEELPNGLYRACWRDDRGNRKSRSGFTQAAAALRYAGERESQGRRGEVSRDGRSLTWGAWCERWLKLRAVEASTARQDAVRVNRYLKPEWSTVRLNRITTADVQAWANELKVTPVASGARPLSAATVDRVVRLFSASLAAAIPDHIAVNPCKGVKLRPPAEGLEHFLTTEEFWAIAGKLDNPWKTAAVMLVGTGLRFGELAGLHWNRVDLQNGYLRVFETWDAASKSIKAYPKSRKPRKVPIPDWAAEYLRSCPPDDGAGCGLPHSDGGVCRSRLVIPAPRGGAMDGHNFGQRAWHDAVKAARVGPKGDQRPVGPTRIHDLRHTCASWLVQDGIPLQEVQRILGHASILVTQRYAHFGDTQEQAIQRSMSQRRQAAESTAPELVP